MTSHNDFLRRYTTDFEKALTRAEREHELVDFPKNKKLTHAFSVFEPFLPESSEVIYMMERFLERISVSEYKDNFIIKGGMLVASMVGVSLRSTMDIDTSLKNQELSEEEARRIVDEIRQIDIHDGVYFEIKDVSGIMDEKEDPVVFMLWGRNARNKAGMIDRNKHLVLECAHPSPLSAYHGFFGCRHFSQANAFLVQHGKEPIHWQIENL